MTETHLTSSVWTEADQAYADFVSEITCEVSVSEDDVYAILGAIEERGLFSVGDAAAQTLSPSAEGDKV